MKTLRQVCAAVILTLVLTLYTLAGDMGFPGDMQPSPPPSLDQMTMTGDTDSSGVTATSDTQTAVVAAVDPITEATLSLIQDTLSVF